MSVDIVNLEICIAEAKRFLNRAQDCLKDLRNIKTSPEDTRLSAAVRRSSMDLTRALAALRDYRR